MEHTPGKWWIGKRRNSEGDVDQVIVADSGTNYRIAELNVSSHGRGEEEQTANARLIAAAPELLEALRGLFEHCAMMHKHWGDNSNHKEADNAIKQAQAVIAKVEGKE